VCHCEERSDEAIPSKDEIAAPFGLAMTVTIIISFVLVTSYFDQKGILTEEQEVILDGLYREKMRWARLGLISEKGVQKDAHRSS
jgi:hypothetical protein